VNTLGAGTVRTPFGRNLLRSTEKGLYRKHRVRVCRNTTVGPELHVSR